MGLFSWDFLVTKKWDFSWEFNEMVKGFNGDLVGFLGI